VTWIGSDENLLASENTLTYDYYKYRTKERPHTSHRERWFITGGGEGDEY